MARANESDRRQERVRRSPRPLDNAALQEMALRYVSRFATTRAKLTTYLARKVKERGWREGEEPARVDALAERLCELGYIDDAAFAVAKAGSLTRRGYGAGRVNQALRQSGVGEADGEEARSLAAREAINSALRFAQRKRLGPWAMQEGDPKTREKALGAMIRAGHGFGLSRAIVETAPGLDLCPDSLCEYVVIKEP